MMPPADQIYEQNEQDPGRVTLTRQEAGSNDFLALGLVLCIPQLNVEGLSAAKRYIGRLNLLHEADVDAVIWLESTATVALVKY